MANNGVIRIGRKGIKKFAFGEDGQPFEVDVVRAHQDWLAIDGALRGEDDKIKAEDIPAYHASAVAFVQQLSQTEVTIAEALDFIARLCEQYGEMADFFQVRSPEKRGSPDTLVSALTFSVEDSLANSMN